MIMTTFAGWLADQRERQDSVGEVARLWVQISPGRTHSLVGVTRAMTEHAERSGLTWVPEAVAATTEEYRAWKVNPEGASIAAPATRSQLDRIESMLARLLDNLGIPLTDGLKLVTGAEDADTEQAGGEVIEHPAVSRMVPHIGPAGLEMRPVSGSSDDASWARMYELADRDLPEDTELGEQDAG